MEASLRIFLFGNIHLLAGEVPVPEFPTRKAKALFGFLVLSPDRIFARETLAGNFWPDASEDRARCSFNTDMWRIRQAFKQACLDPDRFLISRAEGVGFNHASPHWSDVRAFETGLKSTAFPDADSADDRVSTAMAEAVALYRGDLLDGIYDDWCLVRREALRAQLLSALDFLLRHHMARSDWRRALEYGQRLLGQEPLLEEAHRAVMRCHYHMGNRPAALRQYAACAKLLRNELGIEPMEETKRLHSALLSVRPTLPPSGPAGRTEATRPAPADPKAVLEEVDLALANLYAAQDWLEDVSRQLKGKPSPR